MSEPSQAAVARALTLLRAPARSEADTDFLRQFQAEHLMPEPGESPSALAARLSPDLFELRQRMLMDPELVPVTETGLAARPPGPPAAPGAYPIGPDEDAAAAILQDTRGEVDPHFTLTKQDLLPAARDDARTPRTLAGGMIDSLAGTRHAPTDQQIGAFLIGLAHNDRWTGRVRFLMRVGMLALVGAGVAVGGRAAWKARHVAERTGGEVERIQTTTGQFAEEVAPAPDTAVIPKVKSPSGEP